MISQLKNAMVVHIVEPQYAAPTFPDSHHMGTSDFPLKASGNSAVFRVYYDDVSDVPCAKKITFNQLGSFEIPDLREYANTCELLQFNGRIYLARSVYELVYQLPKVREVEILVDFAQSTYSEEKSEYFFRTPRCVNVKTLRVILNLDQQQCDDVLSAENGVIKFVESILKHAGHSFPNLQTLELQLPGHAKLLRVVESLTDVCSDLKWRTIYVVNILSTPNDVNELFQANGMTSFPSDESLSSDDNSSPEPCFSANQLLSDDDDTSNTNSVDVSIQSADQRMISLLSELNSVAAPYLANPELNSLWSTGFAPSYFCESIKESMQGCIGGPWVIEEDDFDKLHLRWIEDLVK